MNDLNTKLIYRVLENDILDAEILRTVEDLENLMAKSNFDILRDIIEIIELD